MKKTNSEVLRIKKSGKLFAVYKNYTELQTFSTLEDATQYVQQNGRFMKQTRDNRNLRQDRVSYGFESGEDCEVQEDVLGELREFLGM